MIKKKEGNKSIIISTHELDHVLPICDKILVLKNGEMILCQDKKDLLPSIADTLTLTLNTNENIKELINQSQLEPPSEIVEQGRKVTLSFQKRQLSYNYLEYFLDKKITLNSFLANDLSQDKPFLEKNFKDNIL